MENEILIYDDWLKEKEGLYEGELMLELINDSSWTEDDIFTRMAELDDEFAEHCNVNKYIPSWNPLENVEDVEVFVSNYKKNNPKNFEY